MSEYARDVSFRLYVDTNKRTIDEEFPTLRDLVSFAQDLAEEGLLSDMDVVLPPEDQEPE